MGLPNHYVTGTHPDHRKRWVYIMELHYGLGLSIRQIVKQYGVPKSTITNAIRAYKPKKGKLDITILIGSSINKETQP